MPPAPPEAPPEVPGGTAPRTGLLIGGAVAVIGLGLGMFGGHNLRSGSATAQQPTGAVKQIGAVASAARPAPTTTQPPPVITGITAQANSNGTQTAYVASVTGQGPFTFTWGWAVNPGCGSLDTTSHGPTTVSNLGPCAPPAEAKAVVLACAQGPTGVSEATRSARYGDLNGRTHPLLVQQGLVSEGFSETHGSGDCASIVASGGQSKPSAAAGTSQPATSTTPDTLPNNSNFKTTAAAATNGNVAVNTAAVAGGIVLLIGPFLVHLRRKPKKPFANKCDAPPCHGCPRSEHCDNELVWAQGSYSQAVFDRQQAQARLKAAEAYEADCREYRFQLLAYCTSCRPSSRRCRHTLPAFSSTSPRCSRR